MLSKKNSQVFNGVVMQVEFVSDENFRYDISGVAQKYGKRFVDFERTDTFKKYLKECIKITFLNKAELVFKVGHHIKVHHLIMIEFMRWINPAFSVLANKLVYDALTAHCQVNKMQLEEKDKEIKTLKERRYAKRRHGDYQVVDRIRQDYNIDCTSKRLNDLLVQAGHLDIEWVTVPKYTPASEYATGGAVPMVYVPELLKIVDKLGIKRDTGFEDSRPRLDFSDGK